MTYSDKMAIAEETAQFRIEPFPKQSRKMPTATRIPMMVISKPRKYRAGSKFAGRIESHICCIVSIEDLLLGKRPVAKQKLATGRFYVLGINKV
jgi:hypothetical protein